jgi:hypothetical protein
MNTYQPAALPGQAYMVLNKAVFMVPLAGLLFDSAAYPALNRLEYWKPLQKGNVRLGVGAVVIG